MTAELGAFALILAFCLSATQAGAAFAARIRRDRILAGCAEGAALAAFIAVGLGFAALIWAFVTSDFSVVNVAQNSHTEKPLIYKIAGAWGSHEGSILLWCFALTGYGAALALARRLPFGLKTLAVGVQGSLGVLFIGYMVFASNPLMRLTNPPVEGRSLNPLLQDPALAAHPPFLYAGYVGLSVVFSLALAGLLEGRVDSAWARWVRPWTLAAWALLTVGITLGSYWAYYELGWGGWWFWDPVENASLMPWLMATALLHSAIVTEKRGALAAWTIFLAIGAFTLSMLGAFLVRSGVLTSVHAFAVDPKRGIILLAVLALTAGTGFALFAWRAPLLRDRAAFAPVSRESALVVNNIVLAAVTCAVLTGTLWPLMLEAFGKQGGVGPPYYDLVVGPLFALALLILPAGPLLAWKRGDGWATLRRLRPAAALAVGAALVTYAVVEPKRAIGVIGVALGLWLVTGAVTEAAERVSLGRIPLAASARRIAAVPRGGWGMSFAHAGLGLFVMGAAFQSGWKLEADAVLGLGQGLDLGAYHLRLDRVGEGPGPNYDSERGSIAVTDASGRLVCRARPERRTYDVGGETTSKVALCAHGLDDLYVVIGDRRARGAQSAWLVRSYLNPWIRLVFLGPILMALGGALSLSDRRLRFALGRRTAAPTPKMAPAE